jgi:hypothetical protein
MGVLLEEQEMIHQHRHHKAILVGMVVHHFSTAVVVVEQVKQEIQ